MDSAIAAISSEARSNSSSESTGVPSKGRSRVISSHDRHPLNVLLLRTYRIPRPVTVKVKDEYMGCRSWCEIQRDLPFEGTPVLCDDEFDRAYEEITGIIDSGGVPALA